MAQEKTEKPQYLDVVVTLRLTRGDLEAIRMAAEQAGVPYTRWMREALVGAAATRTG